MIELEKLIRDVHDFPKPGIIFKDITPLLRDGLALQQAADMLAKPFVDRQVELVAAIESRGFIFGALVARALNAGFVPVRKKGKLPSNTISQDYQLEYGLASIEIHTDAIQPNQKVLLIDDLLATGGTMAATCELVRKLGASIVGVAFLIELTFLGGRERLGDYDVHTLIQVA